MRDGRLLAESPPNDLITSYRMNVSTCDFTCDFHVIKSFCTFKCKLWDITSNNTFYISALTWWFMIVFPFMWLNALSKLDQQKYKDTTSCFDVFNFFNYMWLSCWSSCGWMSTVFFTLCVAHETDISWWTHYHN